MNEIKRKIRHDLDFGITPTYSRLGLAKEEFIDILYELQNKGLIWFNLLEDKTSVFYGEPKYIRITDMGKRYLRSK